MAKSNTPDRHKNTSSENLYSLSKEELCSYLFKYIEQYFFDTDQESLNVYFTHKDEIFMLTITTKEAEYFGQSDFLVCSVRMDGYEFEIVLAGTKEANKYERFSAFRVTNLTFDETVELTESWNEGNYRFSFGLTVRCILDTLEVKIEEERIQQELNAKKITARIRQQQEFEKEAIEVISKHVRG